MYVCPKCKRVWYAMLLSTGTTPYLIKCKTCGHLASSTFYKVHPQPNRHSITADLFLYRPRAWPDDSEMQQWLLNGCLLSAVPGEDDIDLAPAYLSDDQVETFDQFCTRVWGVVPQRN